MKKEKGVEERLEKKKGERGKIEVKRRRRN